MNLNKEFNPFYSFCSVSQRAFQQNYIKNFSILSSNFPKKEIECNRYLEKILDSTLCNEDTQLYFLSLNLSTSKIKSHIYLPNTAISTQLKYVWHPLLSSDNAAMALKERLSIIIANTPQTVTKDTLVNPFAFICSVFFEETSNLNKEYYPPLLKEACIFEFIDIAIQFRLQPWTSELPEYIFSLCKCRVKNPSRQQVLQFINLICESSNMESLRQIFIPVFNYISQDSFQISNLDNPPSEHFIAYSLLFSQEKLAIIFCKIVLNFSPSTTPKSLESHFVFGPILSLSPMPSTFSSHTNFFHSAMRLTLKEKDYTIGIINNALSNLISNFQQIIKLLLKSSQHDCLIWFATFLKMNEARCTMRSEEIDSMFISTPSNFSSDGMGLNVCSLFLKFSDKIFKKAQFKLISPYYCVNPDRVQLIDILHQLQTYSSSVSTAQILDISAQNKLCTFEVDEQEDLILDAHFHFDLSTEVFHLTHYSIHVYYIPLIKKYQNWSRHLSDLLNQIKSTTNNLESNHLNATYNALLSNYFCLESHLIAPYLIELISKFVLFSCEWLLNLVFLNTFAKESIVPIADNFNSNNLCQCVNLPPCQSLTCIPELYLINILEVLNFLHHTAIDKLILLDLDYSKFIHFAVVFLSNPYFVSNPHTRARIAEVLGSLLLSYEENNSNNLYFHYSSKIKRLLCDDQLSLTYLLSGIIKVFADIEITGNEIEFFSRFTYRHSMYGLIDYLWQEKAYQPALIKLCEEIIRPYSSPPIMLRFLNALTNDANFLLDEGLSHIEQVSKIEKLQKSDSWNDMNEKMKEEQSNILSTSSRIAKIHNQLSSKTIHTLINISSTQPQILTIGSIVSSLANMLNYFLMKLVGPNRCSLVINKPVKLNFDPKSLLTNIVQVYVNLKDSTEFLKAVIEDGRCYSNFLFKEVSRVVDMKIPNKELLETWKTLANKVRQLKSNVDKENKLVEDIDIPEEFIDPIMGTLMEDPVILPESQVTLDKLTAEKQVLNSGIDPYTRSKLTMDMLIYNTELKKKIDSWNELRSLKNNINKTC